ncbi:MAG: stage 0 sporulation family protein [Firmicutes bacterium]|nr:stage 0 sporulation family protein [Bacillota bacterium]
MITIIGVRFRHGGKVYSFQPGPYEVQKGDYVVVETARGVEYGQVIHGPRLAADEDIVPPVRTILRKATEQDKEANRRNISMEKSAMDICREKIEKHGLEMKLVGAEYTLDGNKILFYFTADGRVDFRELVKDLASVFRTRIELRQIGVRDEARACASIGICGRPFCCQTFLPDFIPVSIKMAKDQNLSLNPTKISGTCGRLMCCLKYEENTYEELTRNLPSEGDLVETPDGVGEVLHVNILRQLLKVGIREDDKDDVEITEYPTDQVRIVRRRRGRAHSNEEEPMDSEAKRELRELERNGG